MVEKYWLITEYDIGKSKKVLHLFNDKDIFDVIKTQLNCLEHGDFYFIKIQRLDLSELVIPFPEPTTTTGTIHVNKEDTIEKVYGDEI